MIKEKKFGWRHFEEYFKHEHIYTQSQCWPTVGYVNCEVPWFLHCEWMSVIDFYSVAGILQGYPLSIKLFICQLFVNSISILKLLVNESQRFGFFFLKFYDLWMWYVYFDYWLMIKIHFITIERIWKVHHGADFFEKFILENCMKISVLSEQIYLFHILCYFVMLLIVCTRAGVNYNQVKYLYLLLM